MKKRLVLKFIVANSDGTERPLTLVGQFGRTLRALMEAGARGVTALDVSQTWALRLAHYVWVLRHRDGLIIETAWENHDGEAGPGRHARYRLSTNVRVARYDVEAA